MMLISGGEFADSKSVLDAYSDNALNTSYDKDGLLYYAEDTRIQGLANTPKSTEKIKLNNGSTKAVDAMYVSNESSDQVICQMIKSQEEGGAFLINEVALKMPLVYLLQSRGGSTALQTSVANIMNYKSFLTKPLEIWYTTGVANKISQKDQCRLILANVLARIDKCKVAVEPKTGTCLKKNVTTRFAIQGAEATANAVFEKGVKDLTLCQKAVIAAGFNKPISRFNWSFQANVDRGIRQRALDIVKVYASTDPEVAIPQDMCVAEIDGPIKTRVDERLANPKNSWLVKAKKTVQLAVPPDVDVNKFIDFTETMKQEWASILKNNPSWSSNTDIEISVNQDGKSLFHYGSNQSLQKFGASSQQSLGSVAKLLILKIAAEMNKLYGSVIAKKIPQVDDKLHDIAGSSVGLSDIYCESLNQGVYGLAQNLDAELLVKAFEFYNFKDSGTKSPTAADIRVALSTERTSASTKDLQRLIFDLAKLARQNSQLKFIATRPVFGQNCTLSAAKNLLIERDVLFSKTGTYDRSSVITHKLAVWAFYQKSHIYTVVVRVLKPDGLGICSGSGCINHTNMLPLYTKIMAKIQ